MTPAIDKPVKAKPDRRPRKIILESLAYWEGAYDGMKEQRDEALKEKGLIAARLNAIAEDNKALEKRVEGSRKDFADLKARLLAAELVNAEMRGYISRLQEDDVVREELVTTGEPDGQQRIVPKRKHRTFDTPNQFTIDRQEGMGLSDRMYREHRGQDHKPRCWVEY